MPKFSKTTLGIIIRDRIREMRGEKDNRGLERERREAKEKDQMTEERKMGRLVYMVLFCTVIFIMK